MVGDKVTASKPEVVKEAPKSKADKDGCMKVKNLRKTNLNLANGAIEPGKTGKATAAEVSMLGKHLEVV